MFAPAVAWALAAIASFVLSTVAAGAQPENAGGNWHVISTTGGPLVSRTLVLQQAGSTVIGTLGTRIHLQGKRNEEHSHQIDIYWKSSTGEGWATLIFDNAWSSLEGRWGNPGRKPSGTFIGWRIYPTYPPVTGLWNFRATGGERLVSGIAHLEQQGAAVIGSFSNGTGQISGTFPRGVHTLSGIIKGRGGRSGWVRIEFSSDSRALSGVWGTGAPGGPATGMFVATYNTTKPVVTAGLWDVQLTGLETHSVKVTFRQSGNSIIATWPRGHIGGTIPAGSLQMTGTWQTKISSGLITITFSPDGSKFSGTWGYPGRPAKGRVLGVKQ